MVSPWKKSETQLPKQPAVRNRSAKRWRFGALSGILERPRLRARLGIELRKTDSPILSSAGWKGYCRPDYGESLPETPAPKVSLDRVRRPWRRRDKFAPQSVILEYNWRTTANVHDESAQGRRLGHAGYSARPARPPGPSTGSEGRYCG